MSKIATREAFGKVLEEIVIQNEDVIVLDADLSPATKTCYAKNARPKQFFSAGIAEANMVGMAAGLAANHKKPFISSFAMFLAGRAYEQIRNSIGYPHLNVKLCATHAGISVGEDGATHQCNEDIALMRTIPRMLVLQPADAIETTEMFRSLVDYKGPAYIRTCRYATQSVNTDDYQFKLNEIVELKKGKKIAILATGIMVQIAKEAIEELHDIANISLYNVHTLKPINEAQLKEIANNHEVIITAEEHSIIGGLYSAVSEVIHDRPIDPIAIKDTYCESGKPDELMKKYKIDKTAILYCIKKYIGEQI